MDAGNDKTEVSNDNYIPVDKEKLKDEHKEELRKAMELYEQECLKAFSATRSGEVVKKFDLPNVQPLTDVQRDNRMLDMVHQAVGQAFINHGPVITHTVHNAVIRTLNGSAGQDYVGPVYHQPNQFNFAPVGSTTVVPLSASSSQPANATLPPQTSGVPGISEIAN